MQRGILAKKTQRGVERWRQWWWVYQTVLFCLLASEILVEKLSSLNALESSKYQIVCITGQYIYYIIHNTRATTVFIVCFVGAKHTKAHTLSHTQ